MSRSFCVSRNSFMGACPLEKRKEIAGMNVCKLPKTTNRKCRRKRPRSGQQVHRTGTPDLTRDFAVGLSGDSRDTTRKYLPGLRGKLGKEFRVAHVHGACRDVDAAVWHGPIACAEADSTLNTLKFSRHSIRNRCSLEVKISGRLSASRGAAYGASERDCTSLSPNVLVCAGSFYYAL